MLTFLLALLAYLIIGSLAGIIGALLGIGGGSLVVPSLLLVFSFLGFPEEHIMHIAIGTSLCSMVITTLSSSYFHHRKSSVVWEVIKNMFLGIVMGSFAGTLIARELSSDFLQSMFGYFACFIGLLFVKSVKIEPETRKLPNFFTFTLIGMGVACLANLLGIGGGFFMLPLLFYFHFTGQKAAGTSSMTSFLISLGGAIGYLLSAKSEISIPGCFGYVYLPAFLAISLGGLVSSFYGVKLAHYLPINVTRKIFAGFLLIVGLLMIFID